MNRHTIARDLRNSPHYLRYRYWKLRKEGNPPVYCWFIVRPLDYIATQ